MSQSPTDSLTALEPDDPVPDMVELATKPMNHSQRSQSSGPPAAASTTTAGAGVGQLIPGTRKPNRDVIVTPDEPDEDDLYFQERRQRGWLE